MMIAVRVWILLSAWLVGAGWILSALHALNRTGYLLCFVMGMAAATVWLQKASALSNWHPTRWWHKFWRRFKRPAPLLFLLIVLLNLAGGLACQPQNGDSNAYRVPRVLHWLYSGGWHWIHTDDSRMNIAGNGYEWLFAPLILFTRTDRWIFLPNLLSFLLLPGLIFSVFRKMRIGSRTAWWWMWILASGWCYVLQANSTINDSLGVIYALAAVDLALRAGKSENAGDLWLSLLAAALLTGVKQTNLPLLLPWFVAVQPAVRLFLKWPVMSAGAIATSLLVSVAPLACMNWIHVGSWTGFPKVADGQVWAWGGRQELTSPFWGIIGNTFCMSAQNLLPLFFPQAPRWNHAMQQFLQTSFGAHFVQFESFGRLARSASEATAGIGLGIIVLALISIVAVRCCRRLPATNEKRTTDWQLRLMYLAPWVSLLVFMAKVGTYANARQAAPYYVFLFPPILAGAQYIWLTRQRWWQWSALLVLAVTVAYMGFVRGRVFVPTAIVTQLQEKHPHAKLLSVFGDFYLARASVEAQRNFVGQSEAAGENIVGWATICGGAEPGWWMPFGSRQVVRVLPDDTPPKLRQEGIHYVVVDDMILQPTQTIEEWAARYNGKLVHETAFTRDPNSPPGHLYLVHLFD